MFSFLPQNGEKRMKGVQLAIPVVTGTVAISLGKKVGFLNARLESSYFSIDFISYILMERLRLLGI